MSKKSIIWPLVGFAAGLLVCVLGFYRTGTAAPSGARAFANAIEQRQEVIEQLKELNRQLREQNALLRSGKLKVIVSETHKHKH